MVSAGNRRRSIPLSRIAHRMFDTPLAIAPSKYEILVSYLGPRMGFDGLTVESSELLSESDIKELTKNGINVGGIQRPDGTFLAFDDDDDDYGGGSGSKKKAYDVTEDGVAIIRVCGTLTEKSTWYQAYSGMTSYESIGKQVAECDADNNIRAILLNCNTPGGETHGLFDLCDALYSRRGTKPMHGIAKNAALSAGYAIISCCDRVTVTRTGALGSIGVFAGHVDQSGMDQKNGLKFTYVHAGKKKVDGNPHEPLSKSAKTDCQTEVDREYKMFVDLVAKNRNIDADEVYATEAGVLFAENCLPLLGDAVGTLDDAYLSVVQKTGIVIPMGRQTSAAGNVSNISSKVAAMPVADAKRLHGELSGLITEGTVAKTEASTELLTLLGEKAGVKEPIVPAVPVPVVPAATALVVPAAVPATVPAADVKPIVPVAAATNNAAAETDTDPDDEDDEPGDAGKKKSKKGAKGCDPEEEPMEANSPKTVKPEDKLMSREEMQHVASLCSLAGHADLTAKFLTTEGMTVQKVMGELQELRAKADSAQPQVNSFAPAASTSALDKIMTAANALVAGGKSPAEAYASVLRADPGLYRAYTEEKADAMAIPSTARGYATKLQQKLANAGTGEASQILMTRNAGSALAVTA